MLDKESLTSLTTMKTNNGTVINMPPILYLLAQKNLRNNVVEAFFYLLRINNIKLCFNPDVPLGVFIEVQIARYENSNYLKLQTSAGIAIENQSNFCSQIETFKYMDSDDSMEDSFSANEEMEISFSNESYENNDKNIPFVPKLTKQEVYDVKEILRIIENRLHSISRNYVQIQTTSL